MSSSTSSSTRTVRRSIDATTLPNSEKPSAISPALSQIVDSNDTPYSHRVTARWTARSSRASTAAAASCVATQCTVRRRPPHFGHGLFRSRPSIDGRCLPRTPHARHTTRSP